MRKLDDLTDGEIDRLERLPAPTLDPSHLGEALFAARINAWKRNAGQDLATGTSPATLRTCGEAAEDDLLAQFERAQRYRATTLLATGVLAIFGLGRVARWMRASPAVRLDQRWTNWRAGRGFVRDDERPSSTSRNS